MESSNAEVGNHFSFVELLARELSKGDLEVPGFPDVVMRTRSVLEDPKLRSDDGAARLRARFEQLTHALEAPPQLFSVAGRDER